MPEGSEAIEGADFDDEVDTQDINNEDSETSATQEEAEGQTQAEPTKPQGEEGKDVKITEKGTKLDPNPQSALNQQLANERRQRMEYERFLSNPQALKRYVEDLERERGVSHTEPVKTTGEEITLDQVQTTEDMQKYLGQQQNKIDAKLKEVDTLKEGIASQAQEDRIGRTITSEIDEVRSKYAELRPKNADGSDNPDFDKELEKELGDLFDELDLDPKTGKYQGKVSLMRLTDRFMKAAKRGQDQGSKQAQTVVQDRRNGRVTSGTVTESEPDESKLSASQTIAARIKRAATARR